MRTSKKLLSMVLTILMVVGVFSAVASSYAFDDVEAYQTQIALMNELKIVEGYDETTFGYGEDVQRWQMALWIAKIMTGKVEDAYVNWYDTTNYTTFTDINPDQFYGSISYGVENGIIKGYSETEYGPADQITFQDAFTMVVRMLGYGSSAMDATYPWSYVDKAIKLGLDDGLRADYNNEEPATREEIVAILYNALFAPKADGTTFGASKFNLTMDTVVITGTKRGNMFTDAANPSKVAADGSNYVTFNLLKDDGTIQASPSYYLPRTAFAGLGADDLAATLKIGYSYDVVTKDDYTTLLYAKENDTVVIDQDSIKGGDADHTKDVTIGSDAYKAVVSYSTLGNNQGTKTTNDFEVILYTLGDNAAIGSGAYLRDINLNIVDKDGKIILTYIPHFLTGATTPYPAGTYMVELKDAKGVGTGVYRDPVEADWIKAAEAAVWNVPGITLYQAITNTKTQITDVNAYSDTILIDDDGDADYDRGIYIYYSFGKIGTVAKDGADQLTSDGIPGDGRLETDKTSYKDVAFIDIDKYFAGEDYVIKAEDVIGKFCLYAYNSKTNVFYLKKTYETKIGYVTTVNKPAKTITFDQVYFGYNAGNITGTTYAVGVSNLPGGTYNNVLRSYTDFDTLKGRTVNYVLDEKYSAILRIVDYGNDAGYVVIKDSVASLNTNGYANVLAYVNSNIASVITVASVDGYTNVTGSALVNNYLRAGDLFKATKDALGMYHLTYIAPTEFTYYAKDFNLDALGLNFTAGVAYTDTQKLQTLYIDENGKPATQATSVNYDNKKGVSVPFSNFQATKDTVIILVNSIVNDPDDADFRNYPFTSTQIVDNGYLATLNFETSKGVPADGSHIRLMNAFDSFINQSQLKGARIFADVDGDGNAKFVYVVNGTWDGNIAINPSTTQTYLDSNDTIIFVDKNTMETMVATNQTSTGLGVSVGTVYQYTNAIDFIRGGLTSAYTSALYNQRLFAGHFYYVKDGYVVGEAFVGATDQQQPADFGRYDIEVVKISYIDKFVSVYTQWNGGLAGMNEGASIWETSFGKPIVYELNDVTVTYKDGAPKDIVDDFAKIVNTDNSFATAYVYTGNKTGVTYSNQKKLFITTAYSKVGDILTTKTIKNLGLTLGHCALYDSDEEDAEYIGMMFEINAAQYAKLSYFGHGYNDIANDQYAGIDTTLKLYDIKTGAVKDISEANIDTEVYQGLNNKYYLYIFTDVKLLDVTHTVPDDPTTLEAGEYWLVWTNPENTNETFKLHLCGNNRDISEDNYSLIYELTGLWINPYHAEINKGDSIDLEAGFTSIPGWINPDDIEYTWSSNNEGIATVDENGVVTGVAAGTAIITVEAWGKSATSEIVVVVPATGISLDKTTLVLGLDEENAEDTIVATVTPEDTTDTVVWESSDESVVTVDDEGNVTAVGAGTATITASAGSVYAECEVTVIDIVPAEEEEITAEITIKVGETIDLDEANPVDVTWASSDDTIATVDTDGIVTGVAVGVVTITATYDSGETITTVNVVAAE